ncbi:thioredoxin TrxA [Candidatus Palibaumannia cicadellinicola]|uniref:Thioredoxin n=1 Tax=Baumannia cicadellinicola subsp. Homalodisca coagulata TaxID=374463 RepID=Q1LTR8_BAUCH|nr:thioredoxin TrxA [Candidatus Baumannia cicadellinicola]ABF14335.1 thioredoxin 1 [Baumannia cicadellinicola str. Hc (Homalodisca coagulata)]MBS0032934.1 thioredoxin TrxA [Candidatus Baumannia cicadellinicola]MCJ7462370.1 thioredoxin TrxA [Candidatus Baumannia cicadellinicola]MCJ7462917.1 thioredoxin TrxA [Candidatus Baumannia cicadellinicola]
MKDKIINISQENFTQQVLQNEGLFLVDFWAEWCAPCKSITPILAEIANEFNGKVTIVKLNIDENPAIAQKYNVRSIPSLLLFRNGEVVATKVGALSKGQLIEFLNANI